MILICDHRGNGLETVLSPLRGVGFEFDATRNLRETRERLEAGCPTLLIIDPLASGGRVELEELERQQGASPRPPLLLVCDPDDPRPILQAAQALGTQNWDVVNRDASLEEFTIRIERLLAQAAQFEELDELRYRASHDDLTELLRPRFFQARLDEHFSAAQRHDLDLALLLIDLDRFGQINKIFDHTVGDQVIERVGEGIRRSLRTEDAAGRLGGDEFAVALPYTGAVEAAFAVRRLCATLADLSKKPEGGGTELVIAASIGFETIRGRELESVAVLRSHAEIALRSAKQAGGNCGVYYRSLI